MRVRLPRLLQRRRLRRLRRSDVSLVGLRPFGRAAKRRTGAGMFKTFVNIFRIPELRNKVLFTLFMLAIYRIGYHVPLPGVDQTRFAQSKNSGTGGDSAGERIRNYVALFSGGDLNSSTIFGLGIMPYIS